MHPAAEEVEAPPMAAPVQAAPESQSSGIRLPITYVERFGAAEGAA